MLQKANGKMHLAIIIQKTCELLKIIADIGAMFGSLKVENIIIKLDLRKQNILSVKFIGLGSIVNIEDSDQILFPDCIEHLPPDMTNYLLEIQRFAFKDLASYLKYWSKSTCRDK